MEYIPYISDHLCILFKSFDIGFELQIILSYKSEAFLPLFSSYYCCYWQVSCHSALGAFICDHFSPLTLDTFRIFALSFVFWYFMIMLVWYGSFFIHFAGYSYLSGFKIFLELLFSRKFRNNRKYLEIIENYCFYRAKFLISIKSNLSIFPFMYYAFGIVSKNSAYLKITNIFSCFVLRVWKSSCFTFKCILN